MFDIDVHWDWKGNFWHQFFSVSTRSTDSEKFWCHFFLLGLKVI